MKNLIDQYSTFIFDLDGTLIDSAPDIMACFERTFNEYGLVLPVIDKYVIGPPVQNMIKSINSSLADDKIENMTEYFRKSYNESDLSQTKLFDGISEILVELKSKNKNIFLATNKAQTSCLNILSKLNIKHYFKEILCCDSKFSSLNRMITKYEMIAHILENNKIEITSSIMIGDSLHDIEGGMKANIATAGVLYGYCKPELIKNAKPTHLIENL